MGSNVPPLAALTAESVWSPGLLEGVDLITASEESDPPPGQRRPKVAAPITVATIEEEPSLLAWKRARALAPPSHLISAVMRTSLFSSSSSSRSLRRPPLACQYTGPDIVDTDPLPLLLGDKVANATVRHPSRPEDCVPVPEEVLQSGGGGGDAEEAGGVRASDPLGSDIAGALPVEGLVDRGCDVVGLVVAELENHVVDEFKASLAGGRATASWGLWKPSWCAGRRSTHPPRLPRGGGQLPQLRRTSSVGAEGGGAVGRSLECSAVFERARVNVLAAAAE